MMTPKTKTILTAVLIGIVISLVLVVPVASIFWFNVNPSIAELEEEVINRMTLTEEEHQRLYNMMVVGSIIDFGLNLILFMCPTMMVGSLLGLVGGHFWHDEKVKKEQIYDGI